MLPYALFTNGVHNGALYARLLWRTDKHCQNCFSRFVCTTANSSTWWRLYSQNVVLRLRYVIYMFRCIYSSVAAYWGSKMADVVCVLERCSMPSHVKTLVVAMGINNRFDTIPPNYWVYNNAASSYSVSHTSSSSLISATRRREASTSRWRKSLTLLPALELRPCRPYDFARYSFNSADKLVKFINSCLALN